MGGQTVERFPLNLPLWGIALIEKNDPSLSVSFGGLQVAARVPSVTLRMCVGMSPNAHFFSHFVLGSDQTKLHRFLESISLLQPLFEAEAFSD